jgi:hypothetical protein
MKNYILDMPVKGLKHLPILKLDDGSELFSTNAAMKFLYPAKENPVLCDEVINPSKTAQNLLIHAYFLLLNVSGWNGVQHSLVPA